MKKAVFSLIFVISVLVSLYYGFQKSGFHEDEYYTYFSSNRSLGLYQPDRQWQDRQTILDEFTVKPGEGFNYGLVKLVQSWDVHPPLYYCIFHTLCSFVPGTFTKWTGLLTNLIAFAIAYVFMCLLMERLKIPFPVMVLTLVFWGLNPQTVSCNMLIRMYAFLGAAIIACGYYHVKLIQDYDNNSLELKAFLVKSLLPIMVVSYMGFLVQYFYIFFFITIGAATSVYIVFVRKDIRNGIVYVTGCAISLGLAVLTYPASLRHMFGGYRGTGASGSFFDIANTGLRLSFFVGLLNDFVFSGGLIIIIMMIILGLMLRLTGKQTKKRSQKRQRPEVVILAIGAVSYFLLTSKTALLVGSASNRYEMPIYGLLIMLIFLDVNYVLTDLGNPVLIYGFYFIMIALLIKGHTYDKNVLFLYQEDREKIAYATEHEDEIAVVMFNPATAHNVWRLTDELLCYPKVFYMDEENLDPITEERIIAADRIILYAADDDCQQQAFANLLQSTGLSVMSSIDTEDMWTTYEVN